jgi:hypothetical protein
MGYELHIHRADPTLADRGDEKLHVDRVLLAGHGDLALAELPTDDEFSAMRVMANQATNSSGL